MTFFGLFMAGLNSRRDLTGIKPCSIFFVEGDAGGWGPWSQWTPCSSSCVGGTRNRYRFCDNPPPRYGAQFCQVRFFLVILDRKYFRINKKMILLYYKIFNKYTLTYISKKFNNVYTLLKLRIKARNS